MLRTSTRRTFLTAASGLAATLTAGFVGPRLAAQRTPQPLPSPNAPRNQNVPGGFDIHPTDTPAALPVSSFNAAQLVAMVQQLYSMAGELRQETDRTNFKDTLPVDFIRRAQQIEKLAKNIREKARG